MAGRLAMHLQGKMAPNQVHVRVAVYPALKPRGVDLAEGALQVGVFIDRTPVTAVKGRCPRPLDEGDETFVGIRKTNRVFPAIWWS